MAAQASAKTVFVYIPYLDAYHPFACTSATELVNDLQAWLRREAKGTRRLVPHVIGMKTRKQVPIHLDDQTWAGVVTSNGMQLSYVAEGYELSSDQKTRLNLKDVQEAALEGRTEDIKNYAKKLRKWKEVVHAKCGGPQYATADTLMEIRCVQCSLDKPAQVQYSGRTLNDIDKFMLTHYATCIAHRLDPVPEAVQTASADAKRRAEMHIKAAVSSNTSESSRKAEMERSREERADNKARRVQSGLADYFKDRASPAPPPTPSVPAPPSLTPVPAASVFGNNL